jgi:inhibitor of cysteine peptidase
MKRQKRVHGSVFGTLLIFALLFALGGCHGLGTDHSSSSPSSPENELNTFSSSQELEDYLKDQYAKSVIPQDAYRTNTPGGGAGGGGGYDEGDSMEYGTDYTGTNIQEEGVDEADVAKTDGHYMYIAKSRSISIVDMENAIQLQSLLELPGIVNSMYLYEDFLVVLYTPSDFEGQNWCAMEPATDLFVGFPCWVPIDRKVGISVYDVSGPAMPELLKTMEFEGLQVSSRLIAGKLYLVIHYVPELPSMITRYDPDSQDYEEVVGENLERLQGLTLEDLVPFYRQLYPVSGDTGESQIVDAQNVYRPSGDGEGGSIVSIITVDLDRLSEPFTSVAIVSDARTVYASTRALYIISDRYVREGEDDTWATTYTDIHKFDLTDTGVHSAGSGAVRGWVLNQFSMGEHDDVLRIATTSGNAWWSSEGQSNNVYCLKASGGQMQVIGSLEGLAPGESIYSARFIGERGFLVTFEKVDPLFTLDLSDPTAPQVIGELKVPGYSNYIHPYDENHLITIGKDVIVDEDISWYQGVQLSLFDISNFEDPQLLYAELIGDRGTNSDALYTHKAFTFWQANRLLAIPIDLFTHSGEPPNLWTYGEYESSGLYVYRVTVENGFQRLGILLTQPYRESSYPYMIWTRGIFAGENVYAATPDTFVKARFEDIESTVQTISLTSE